MQLNETDEQQVEALKKWWKENGSSVVTGLLLGLAILFGAKSWFAYQQRTAENASNIYATMMAAVSTGEEQLVNEKAAVLIADFSSTPYASFAALALAKLRLEQGELEAARAQLQWAKEHADSDIIREIATLRLANVLVAEKDLDAAEALVNQAKPDSPFAPLLDELSGDIHAARGDLDKARSAYERALAAMTPESPTRQLLQLKYENTVPAAEPDET